MGALNSDTTFVESMMKLLKERNTLAKDIDMKNALLKIIVDDALLHGRTSEHLLEYLGTVLYALKHHHDIINLKN